MKNLPATINGAQKLFVQVLVDTGDPLEAARRCRLMPDQGAELARNPLVIKEIRREVLAKLHSEVLPRAYRLLVNMAEQAINLPNDQKSNSVRDGTKLKERYVVPRGNLDFVKLVFERTGVAVQKDGEATRDLAEMSLDELHALVNRLEAERSEAAKPVSAQEVQADTSQARDFLE